MGRYATAGEGGDFTPAPAGPHVARCFRFLDLGTQHSEMYNKDQEKIMLGFEILDATMEDGKPFVVFKTYTLSLNKKANLHHDLVGWRGRDFTKDELKKFDVTTVINSYCMINVIHKEKQDGDVQARIGSIMPMPPGMDKPKAVNAKQVLLLDPGDFDPQLYESLSDNMKAWIARSPEYRAVAGGAEPAPVADPAPAPDDQDDDVPF